MGQRKTKESNQPKPGDERLEIQINQRGDTQELFFQEGLHPPKPEKKKGEK